MTDWPWNEGKDPALGSIWLEKLSGGWVWATYESEGTPEVIYTIPLSLCRLGLGGWCRSTLSRSPSPGQGCQLEGAGRSLQTCQELGTTVVESHLGSLHNQKQ